MLLEGHMCSPGSWQTDKWAPDLFHQARIINICDSADMPAASCRASSSSNATYMPDTLQSGQSSSQASTPSMQSATVAARGFSTPLLPDVTPKHVDHCRLEDTDTGTLPHMLHEVRGFRTWHADRHCHYQWLFRVCACSIATIYAGTETQVGSSMTAGLTAVG